MTAPAKYSPEWYERRNARARERRAAERAALPRPGSAAFDALPSYAAKAEARNYYWRELQKDAPALLAALRDARDRLRWHAENDPSRYHRPEDAEALGRVETLLAKHEGADR